MPAAGSRWPTDALTPVIVDRESTLLRARTSVGSPSAVPVPCDSTELTSVDSSAAREVASPSSIAWALPLGAVRLALVPSCLTELPQSRARVGVLVSSPPSLRPSTMPPTPSPRT